MERRKNVAAYQVSLSAVKNIQVAKSGIAKTNELNPARVAHFESLL